MASPEFLKMSPQVQDAFVLHRQAHQFNMQSKLAQAVQQQQALTPPGADGGAGGGAPPSGGGPPTTAADPRPQPAALPRGQAPISAPAPPPQLN
jgi:hypothetical protein